MQITLDQLRPGRNGIVLALDTPKPLTARLRDFGMIPGTQVRCCYRSPQGKVTALEFMGSVLAIRTVYLENIQVEC